MAPRTAGTAISDFARRITLARWVFLSMASSSFALGGWMILQPNGFWELMGAPSAGGAAMAVATRVVYGAAICGEGVMLAAGWRRPLRYLTFLHYMMAYKAIACVALAARLVGVSPTPWGGWAVVGAWAVAGGMAAAAYPWGRWPQIVAAMQQELDADEMGLQ